MVFPLGEYLQMVRTQGFFLQRYEYHFYDRDCVYYLFVPVLMMN